LDAEDIRRTKPQPEARHDHIEGAQRFALAYGAVHIGKGIKNLASSLEV
jgi:hypothetical protein